jgi:hypothetical protein
MHAIGAFERFTGLHEALEENYSKLDDTDILQIAISDPIFEIVRKVENEEMNCYVGRESFRRRMEMLHEVYGINTAGIEWDDVISNRWDVYDEIFDGEVWWEIYAEDDDVIAKAALLCGEDPAPDPFDLALALRDYVEGFIGLIHVDHGWLYVVKSDTLKGCELTSGHWFDNVCTAEHNGDTIAYVLDDEVLEMALRLEVQYEEIFRKLEATP